MIHYITPSRMIGKHEWRLVVRDSKRGYGRVTDFEFRNPDGDWSSHTLWPAYNSNDGTFAGCPKGLRALYQDHEDEVRAAIAGTAYRDPQQSLFAEVGTSP